MATKISIVCDLEEGKERDGQSVTFGLDGASWTIDLCTKHRTKFDKDFMPFRDHARKLRASRPLRPSRPLTNRAADIRQWAAESGIPVSPNGRIAAAVEAQYDASQNGSGGR